MKRVVFGAVLLACTLFGQFAGASPSPADKERAKKLYGQGAADMERGAYDRACPQFAAALQLDPEHIRTAMTLGTCEQQWGKLAQALTRFEYARSLAKAQYAADKLAEIDWMIAYLMPKVPQMRIILPASMADVSGLQVTRNGAPVPTNEFGLFAPVDPGNYEIVMLVPNQSPSTQKLKIEAGQAMEVTLGTTNPPVLVERVPPDQMAKNSKSTSERPIGRSLGFTGIGLGGAGLVVGAILGGLAISKNNASDDGHCDAGDFCDAVGAQLRREAQGYGNGSTAAFIVGGAFLTAGIVLVATTPGAKDKAAASSGTKVYVGLNQVGIRGTF
jgi:hypothetical protein